MAHEQQQPLAFWNPNRDVWETTTLDLLSEQPAVFSETWPASGTMRNGVLYRPATSGPATDGPESSCSPGTLLPTPSASLGVCGGSQHPAKRAANRRTIQLHDVVEHLLPTPSARDWKDGTPPAGGGAVERAAGAGGVDPDSPVWGRYRAAVKRHARLLGGPVPAPTVPGRFGQPRLAAEFVEWMMALPAGWVTGVEGVTRKQQLMMLGNGVVTPQAVAALRDMTAAAGVTL